MTDQWIRFCLVFDILPAIFHVCQSYCLLLCRKENNKNKGLSLLCGKMAKFHSKRLQFLPHFTRKMRILFVTIMFSKEGIFTDMKMISQCSVEDFGVGICSRCMHVSASACVVFCSLLFLQKKCKLFIDWITSDKLHYSWMLTFKCLDVCFGILMCSAMCLSLSFISYEVLVPSRSVCFTDF